MRLLVCGGRRYDNRELVVRVLDWIHRVRPIAVLLNGAATGADSLARSWAYRARVKVENYPANWTRDGNKAGSIRNAAMLRIGQPDMVLAFPGDYGTGDMVGRAYAASVSVSFINEDRLSYTSPPKQLPRTIKSA